VFKPPEGGPRKGDVAGTGLAHAFHLGNGGRVISGRAPVETVFLDERQGFGLRGQTCTWFVFTLAVGLFGQDVQDYRMKNSVSETGDFPADLRHFRLYPVNPVFDYFVCLACFAVFDSIKKSNYV
jgi:hypothetical protein